jgi:hypothetical protein
MLVDDWRKSRFDEKSFRLAKPTGKTSCEPELNPS